MPGKVKETFCVVCGDKEENNFYKGYKTLCKKHGSLRNDPKVKKKISRQYFCVVCGEDKEEQFHKYRKNLCFDHYNYKLTGRTDLLEPPVITTIFEDEDS